MKCLQRDSELQAFLDGELDHATAVRFQQHVMGCPSCQSRLQFFQDLRSAWRAQANADKISPRVRDEIGRRLGQLDRARRRIWKAAVVIAALAILGCLSGGYWLYMGWEGSPIITELANAHASAVRGEAALTASVVDSDMFQHWLEARLPFHPRIPRAGWGGFLLLGARTLSLSNHEAALVLFGRGERRVSLVSLPDPEQIPDSGKQIEMDGVRFWIFTQGIYSLVLWAEYGFLNAMVSDEEPEETLEYARLCTQQMRAAPSDNPT